MSSTREQMVRYQIKGRGIKDVRVLDAMSTIERELFVPDDLKSHAYDDGPLPIGEGQTISQPYIVAFMAEKLQLQPDHKILEIGTGCGYNAAIMAMLVKHVYSIELNEWLSKTARQNLENARIDNVSLRIGDGYQGWPEEAPFDAIALTAAPPEIPQPLIDQLKIGGRLLAPVGNMNQRLILLEKKSDHNITEQNLLPVSFVSMRGKAQN